MTSLFDFGGPQYGLRDGKVGTWDGDGTYSNVTDIPSIQLLSGAPQTVTQDLEGDDEITATAARTTSAEVRVRFGSIDLDVINVITGMPMQSSGSAPTSRRNLQINNKRYPYIGVGGRALAEEGDGDTHMFIPKCKVTSGFEIKFEYNTFAIPELTLRAVADSNFPDENGNNLIMELVQYETATEVALPPTAA